MITQPNKYQFTFTVAMDMDASDISIFAAELEQSINDWIDHNTNYDHTQVPVEIRRHIVQCVYDRIMTKEWEWE